MKKTTRLVGALLVLLVAALSAPAQEFSPLDAAEQQAMSDALQYALEFQPTQKAAEWVNPDTGRSGAVVPVRTIESAQGGPCREFITTIIIGGREEQGYGTACRQPDGSWEIVSDDPPGPPGPPGPTYAQPAQPAVPAPAPVREVYVYPPPPPVHYYEYPAGFYGPSRIFLSFSYVYRSGSHYWGRVYRDGRDFRYRYPIVVRERVYVGPRVHDYYWKDRGRGRGWDDRPGWDDRRGGRDDRRDVRRDDRRDDRRDGRRDDRRDDRRGGQWPDPDRRSRGRDRR
jgi:surface antigen